MNTPPDPPAMRLPLSRPDRDDFARQVAKVRHDLRNPVAHILGFSEMLIEKARERGYNFLKGRLELVERLGQEMLGQINRRLEPGEIEAGRSDLPGLKRWLHSRATRIVRVTEALSHKALVRQDDLLNADIARIGGAARGILELAETALAILFRERDTGGKAATPMGPPPEAGSAPIGREALPPARGVGDCRVLMVVGEGSGREVLKKALAKLGCSAALAAPGPRARELASRNPFDLMLLGLRPPASEGLQFLQELKKDAATRALPVLVLTETEDMELTARALELGADDYLPLPLQDTLLRVRIESAMARRKLREL